MRVFFNRFVRPSDPPPGKERPERDYPWQDQQPQRLWRTGDSGIEPGHSAGQKHQRECHADENVCFECADHELGDHKRHGAQPPLSHSQEPEING
jgi:hypothetical protein